MLDIDNVTALRRASRDGAAAGVPARQVRFGTNIPGFMALLWATPPQ
jgi:hypothetical protein